MELDRAAEFDVIVVGAGNAATCAALSARENGARVRDAGDRAGGPAGGNSAFTGGAFRVVYHGFDDLRAADPRHERARARQCRFRHLHRGAVFRRYGPADRMALRPRPHRDPDHAAASRPALWMREKGVRFQLGLGRQAFKVDGKFKFWGGLACHIWGGGKELIKALHAAPRARRHPGASTRPRRSASCRAIAGSRACGCATRAVSSNCGQRRWCSPAAGSRPMPRCARAISAPIGIWPRCAAPNTTPARGSRWRSISAPPSAGHWSGAMRCSGI